MAPAPLGHAGLTRMRVIQTDRLRLEPLTVGHTEAMFDVLTGPSIYRYIDQAPPLSREQLRQTFARWEERRSPDGSQTWLNWVIRSPAAATLGYVQATIIDPAEANVAYVLGHSFWGHGYATEAVQAMLLELAATYRVKRCVAIVEAANGPSVRLLERLGFRRGAEEDLAGRDLSTTEWLFIRLM